MKEAVNPLSEELVPPLSLLNYAENEAATGPERARHTHTKTRLHLTSFMNVRSSWIIMGYQQEASDISSTITVQQKTGMLHYPPLSLAVLKSVCLSPSCMYVHGSMWHCRFMVSYQCL